MTFVKSAFLCDDEPVLDPFQLLGQFKSVRLNFLYKLSQVPNDLVFTISVEVLLLEFA